MSRVKVQIAWMEEDDMDDDRVPRSGDLVYLGSYHPDNVLRRAKFEMFETNMSNQTRLRGWCGSTNGVNLNAVGAGIVRRVQRLYDRDYDRVRYRLSVEPVPDDEVELLALKKP